MLPCKGPPEARAMDRASGSFDEGRSTGGSRASIEGISSHPGSLGASETARSLGKPTLSSKEGRTGMRASMRSMGRRGSVSGKMNEVRAKMKEVTMNSYGDERLLEKICKSIHDYRLTIRGEEGGEDAMFKMDDEIEKMKVEDVVGGEEEEVEGEVNEN